LKRNELESVERPGDAAPRLRREPAPPRARFSEATVVLAVCLGSTILLIGIGLFFRLVTGLSVLP